MDADRLRREHVARVYDSIAERFDGTRTAIWRGADAFFSSLSPGSLVLDLGCGNGKYERCGKYSGLFFEGVDACRALLEIASAGAPSAGWAQADALRLPFRDGSFDAAASIAVLHHVARDCDRTRFIDEMLRVLRPGGRAFVTVWASSAAKPDWKPLGASGDWLVPWKGSNGVDWRYYHLFEEREFRELVSARADVELVAFERDNWCATLTAFGAA